MVRAINRQGLHDWVIQRISAIIIAVYSIALMGYLICHPGLAFAQWHDLFAQKWMQIATILFLLALLWHAWIGVWTVITDYVKPAALRAVVHVIVFLTLAACFVWGILIVGSV
jgi:succinate dehydrogenase / fumarate reductase membrane anchor subunit